MKLIPKKNDGSGRSRLRPARLRLASAPLPARGRSRLGKATGRFEPDAAAPTPAPDREHTTPAPVDSVRGDALLLYLREIGQVKLLTPEEEVALARRVRKGDKKAREQMIKANLRLVVKIARDYEGLGVPLLDLVNEGNIGLMKGVQRFDPRKGAKLSTYASWWIKQAIKRALANQAKTIRLPVHVVDKLTHMRRKEASLRETLDREPTDEELAQELGLDPRRVKQYREASKAPVSLDAPVGDDDSSRVSEVVADPGATLPSERLVQETDLDLMREILSKLPERERTIVALRFGLGTDSEQTLEEVGARFGLTRERIRQIQEQALKKMRAEFQERNQPNLEEDDDLVVRS